MGLMLLVVSSPVLISPCLVILKCVLTNSGRKNLLSKVWFFRFVLKSSPCDVHHVPNVSANVARATQPTMAAGSW